MERDREQKAKMLFALAKLQNKELAGAFSRWAEQWRELKAVQLHLTRFVSRWRHRPMASAFGTWHWKACEARRLRAGCVLHGACNTRHTTSDRLLLFGAVAERVKRRMQNREVR